MTEFLCWIEKHPGLAAWIQAIFSIIAIIAVFGVAMYQNSKARKQAKEESDNRETHFLRSIRIELTVLRDGFMETMRIQEIPPPGNRPLIQGYYYPPEKPFAIYDAIAGNILDVKDDEKRKLIISTYAKAKTVLLVLKLNNDNLRTFEKAQKATAFREQELANAKSLVVESSEQFWVRLDETLKKITEMEKTFPSN